MAFKLIVLTAIVALSSAVPVEHASSYASLSFFPIAHDSAPAATGYGGLGGYGGYGGLGGSGSQGGSGGQGGYGGHHEEPHAIPHYSYKYGVHDPHTHDIKEQEESREHDHTKGFYSLHDPHYKRVVHYVVPDKHSGFNAEFKYNVADPKHHDFKERAEKIDGHQITGHYSFLQPDGHKRIVHYTADKHNGFNAKVEYVKA